MWMERVCNKRVEVRGLTTLAPEPTFVNTGVRYVPLLTPFSL